MSGAPRRAHIVAVAVVAVTAVALAFRSPVAPSARPPGDRPPLLLLTSLPLVFGAGFSVGDSGSPALKVLESRYRVVPISVSDSAELAKGRLLLMAQPRPQPAEDLVALDQWVSAGGRVLLLADPMLEWPGEQPLGDPLRPPQMFMDTGLLGHWGLRLDAPDERGTRAAKLGGYNILTASPGLLFGGCAISTDRLVAHCTIGKGRATIVTDADLLDVEHLDGPNNLNGVAAELARLEQP
jgi:hypothetical protein